MPGFLCVILPHQSSVWLDKATNLSKDVRSRQGESDIFNEVENGDVEWVESLLTQGLSPETSSHCGMSPLHSLALIKDENSATFV